MEPAPRKSTVLKAEWLKTSSRQAPIATSAEPVTPYERSSNPAPTARNIRPMFSVVE